MKISKKLPQFNREARLIIASGEIDAKLYLAENGEINEVKNIKSEKPRYSDSEGQVFLMKKETVLEPFLKKLNIELKNILERNSIKEVFLFCPTNLDNKILRHVPKEIRSKVKLKVKGNFNSLHPFKLLGKINDLYFKNKKIIPTSDEANKILKR